MARARAAQSSQRAVVTGRSSSIHAAFNPELDGSMT